MKNRIAPDEIRRVADCAVEELGWHRRDVRPGLAFPDLFPEVPAARPLQEALAKAMDHPGLYIVEAPMGEGKTEAALAGAYRRWTSGDERGLYFALPTQLTSKRIHERVATFLGRVVSDPAVHALIHGNAWLLPDRLRSVIPDTTPSSNSSDLLEWYASGRKALLAAFGTGTVDQALMATLPVKHSGLRLFSLSGKVVVIDEVHSYDPYTSALVDKTVSWLLELGSTVIILSATLSTARRTALLKAAGASESTSSAASPLITKATAGNPLAETIPVAASNQHTRSVEIKFAAIDSLEELEKMAEAAEHGACVLITRNTVALAQETYRFIKSSLRDREIPCELLHSRLPQFQRSEKERYWMDALGRSDEKRPSGCVLIATQVVEQSVDIDADLLLADLAPVDIVLQRLGRLHRHRRARASGFEAARCHTLLPNLPGRGIKRQGIERCAWSFRIRLSPSFADKRATHSPSLAKPSPAPSSGHPSHG